MIRICSAEEVARYCKFFMQYCLGLFSPACWSCLLKAGICLKLMVFYLKIYRKRKIGNRREHLSDGTIRKELMF